MTPLVVACGLGVAVGGSVLAWSWWADRSQGEANAPPRSGRTGPSARNGAWRRLLAGRRDVPRLLAALVGGVVALWVTGWPVALPIAAGALFGLPKLFAQTSGSAAITRIEAVAGWTEMLNGTLAASAGLGQAIAATAPLAPLPIRPATTRLSARLAAGAHPREALLQFADELADPSADRVVCALLLAMTARAQKLGDVLTALAESTRDEVALRLRIETSRAAVRSGIRTVLVFSVAFAVGLVGLAHAYLAPFGTARGQLLLALVGLLYAAGLTLMVSLARSPAPVRLLGDQVVVR